MKPKSHYYIIYIFSIVFSSLFSCSEEDTIIQENSISSEFGNFTKEVIIFDENSQNSAVLLLGSDDNSILEGWSSENFVLVPIKENQSFIDALNCDSLTKEESISDTNDDSNQSENVASSISIIFKSKNLETGIKNVALRTIPPVDDSRDWNYATYYSQINVDKTFYIERDSWLFRVFFGLKYMNTSTSSWSTVVSEWDKISDGESYSITLDPCYQMKARVKYRQSDDYTVYFEE